MVPEIVQSIAIYVGLVRDLLLLLLLLAILLAVIFTYRKVSKAIGSVTRIIQTSEEVISTVSESIVKPAASGSGVAFGLGKIVAFIRGMRK